MSYDLNDRLVIGIASSALFDLAESDAVFRQEGEASYRRFQEEHLDDPLAAGVAFPFIRRLLSLNDLAPPGDPLVEVLVLSRNDPDTGLRVMRSIAHHGLGVTRSIFTEGKAPYIYMPALNMSLFLSANGDDVRRAIALGLPAGQVLDSEYTDDGTDQVRVGFDFDGVLASDESEQFFQERGLAEYQQHEAAHANTPISPGPLQPLLQNINRIQQWEERRAREDPSYSRRLHVSLITARAAPAHERAVVSLKAWGVRVNDAFFLGGIDKGPILEVLRPHMYFDDQRRHLSSRVVPSVHVPFGKINETSDSMAPEALRHILQTSNGRSDKIPQRPRRRAGRRAGAALDASRADADPHRGS